MVKRTEYEYKMIDGNWTRHPVAYCTRYKGVLTEKMIKTHKCVGHPKQCKRYRKQEFE